MKLLQVGGVAVIWPARRSTILCRCWRLLATNDSSGIVGGNNPVWLWDASGRLLSVLRHTALVNDDVVFSSAGGLLATQGLYDDTARLWETASRGTVEPLATLTGHSGDVHKVTFSPDGALLAIGVYLDADPVLDLDPDRLVDRACADPDNHITAEEWAEYVPDVPYDPPCD